MHANPGTKWACPITIPCRNELTIMTLRATLTHNHSEGNEKTKEEKLQKFIMLLN